MLGELIANSKKINSVKFDGFWYILEIFILPLKPSFSALLVILSEDQAAQLIIFHGPFSCVVNLAGIDAYTNSAIPSAVFTKLSISISARQIAVVRLRLP